MEIDEHHPGLGLHGRDFVEHDAKRIVDGRHEHTAHHVDDGDRDAVAGRDHRDAAARRAGRKIRGPDQARLLGEVRKDLFLVPRVIAAGHHVNAVREKVVGDLRRDPEPGSGILDVGDDEIDVVVRDERRQATPHELTTRTPDDVSDEEEPRHPR